MFVIVRVNICENLKVRVVNQPSNCLMYANASPSNSFTRLLWVNSEASREINLIGANALLLTGVNF